MGGNCAQRLPGVNILTIISDGLSTLSDVTDEAELWKKAQGARVEGREAGRPGGWKAGRLGRWKAGRLEGWKAGTLEGREAGRLGGWEAGRLGGWKAGKLGGRDAGKIVGWHFTCHRTRFQGPLSHR